MRCSHQFPRVYSYVLILSPIFLWITSSKGTMTQLALPPLEIFETFDVEHRLYGSLGAMRRELSQALLSWSAARQQQRAKHLVCSLYHSGAAPVGLLAVPATLRRRASAAYRQAGSSH